MNCIDMDKEISSILISNGIKPTPNRVLVAKAIRDSDSPMSLVELETKLGNLERSSILRTLLTLKLHNIILDMEDGRGISKYEFAQGAETSAHVHFYCESCRRVYCFEHIEIPQITLPQEFNVSKANYMLKGTCPECQRKSNFSH